MQAQRAKGKIQRRLVNPFIVGCMKDTEFRGADNELAIRVARLWPNREHEASAVFGLLCRIGVHRWRGLDLKSLVPERTIHYCFWCSKIRIDGIVYDA